MNPLLVIHGGAGRVAADEQAQVIAGLREAANRGFLLLEQGKSALEAAVEAVAQLEDRLPFNAGRGSVLTEEGTVEMDASVMEGSELRAGAVARIASVRSPVRLAEAVLRMGREVFLVGDAAERWARSKGCELWDPFDLQAAAPKSPSRRSSSERGTVGAVALDVHGHVAAATSTGGRSGKREGRVGDSAVIGAGTYADNRGGAASATGDGEAILRLCLTSWAVTRLSSGLAPERVAKEAITRLTRLTGGQGGLILVDVLGRWGVAHNTPQMPHAWVSAGMYECRVALSSSAGTERGGKECLV